jgi:hypothetical protein
MICGERSRQLGEWSLLFGVELGGLAVKTYTERGF